jgi:hypothetical protein
MRDYVIIAANITVAGATTLIWINPGTTASIEVTRLEIGQNTDATSRMIRVRASRQPSTFPTLTSFTPERVDPRDAASVIAGGTAGAAGTCGINASAEGGGSKTMLTEWNFNNQNGLLWVPSPGQEIILPASAASGLALHFPAAPTTLTGWTAQLWFRER